MRYDYWFERTSPDWIKLNNQSPTQAAFSLTLYNETADMLADTLRSIANNCLDLQIRNASHSGVVVCIISDGADRLSQCSHSYVNRLGIYQKTDQLVAGGDGVHIVDTTIPLSKILGTDHQFDVSPEIRVLFCVKGRNFGKLDSHWWFYEKICPQINPEYCFQLDAGTVLDQSALFHMYQHFERKSKATTAAVASTVLLDCQNPLDLLSSFQASDFVVEKSLAFPSEEFFGYLSVMPGQFSGVLWKALAGNTESGSTPKDKYLSGLNCQSGFEKTKFLAEDRVLGYELLADPSANNQIEFSSRAVARTDRCDSLRELLKQRRRWVNSSFICRTWMIKNIVQYAKKPGIALSKRLQIYLSSLNFIAFHLLDFFMPLWSALILQQTYMSLDSILQKTQLFSATTKWSIFATLLIGWLFPTLYAIFDGDKRERRALTNAMLWFAASCGTAMLLIGCLDGKYWYLAVMLVILIVVSILSLFSHGRATTIWAQGAMSYIFLSGPVKLMLTTYAFLNIDDSSWGTKGLDKHRDGSVNIALLTKSLLHLKRVFLTLWVVLNAVFIVLVFTVEQAPLYGMLTLFGATSFIAVAAILGMSRRTSKAVLRRVLAFRRTHTDSDTELI